MEGVGYRRSLWSVVWEIAGSWLGDTNPAFPVTKTGDAGDLIIAALAFGIGGVCGALVFMCTSGRKTSVPDDEVEFLESIKKYCALPQERIQVSQVLDESVMSRVPAGVLFIHAPWSANSIRALLSISTVLNCEEYNGVAFYVIDIRHVHLNAAHFGGMRFGGYGETFWIKDNTIVKKMSDYQHENDEELKQATREVLVPEHPKAFLRE
jgi:hypothetical protein